MKRLIQRMQQNCLVALGDWHTNTAARELTWALVDSGHVEILFIEWPDLNQLNRQADLMIQQGLDYEGAAAALAVGGYFAGINPGDVAPTLPQLAAHCISRNVRVAACDLHRAEALARIAELRRIENYEPPLEGILFGDEGFAVRDDHAATMIDRESGTIRTGRLMLWGDGHFRDYDNRYLKPRYMRLRPDDRFSVIQNNLLKKLKATRSIFEVFYVPNGEIQMYL